MDACVADWVTPLLGELEDHNPDETARYDQLFPSYVDLRHAMQPVWKQLASRGAP